MYIAFETNIYVQSYNTDNITSHSTYLNLRIREFEPCSGQTKDYKIGICFFFANHTALRNKGKG